MRFFFFFTQLVRFKWVVSGWLKSTLDMVTISVFYLVSIGDVIKPFRCENAIVAIMLSFRPQKDHSKWHYFEAQPPFRTAPCLLCLRIEQSSPVSELRCWASTIGLLLNVDGTSTCRPCYLHDFSYTLDNVSCLRQRLVNLLEADVCLYVIVLHQGCVGRVVICLPSRCNTQIRCTMRCVCVCADRGTYNPVTRTESPVLQLARSLNNTSLAEGTLDIIATLFVLTKAPNLNQCCLKNFNWLIHKLHVTGFKSEIGLSIPTHTHTHIALLLHSFILLSYNV